MRFAHGKAVVSYTLLRPSVVSPFFRWGTLYDHGDDSYRNELIGFAVQKLLCDSSFELDSWPKKYAVLSQRLALDVNSTAHVSIPPVNAYYATLDQIATHMRVCVEIGQGAESIRGIAASEPILSEAASSVMRRSDFNLASALSEVLSRLSINIGDRGELIVAAFFTWARDAVANRYDNRLPATQYCCRFSVEELFSNLFSETTVQLMFKNIASICPSKTERRTLGDVASTAKMHFNHFIQAQEQNIIAHQYLIGFMARGAAVLCANYEPGFDAVFPYLFGSTDLDKKNVGFIMVQVKNDNNLNSRPDAELFRKMDPFDCDLLDASDVDGCFSIPIIRIVFDLRGEGPTITHMAYSSPLEGARSSSLDEHGEPRFMSYDYWCSGIKSLEPVQGALSSWEALLNQTGPWPSFYDRSSAPEVLRSQFPVSSSHESHMDRWSSDEWRGSRRK
jgi:hypothetical protein